LVYKAQSLKNKVILLFVFGFHLLSFSQIKDIGGTDFTEFYGKSKDPNFIRNRIWINYPIKLKKKDHFIVTGIKYSKIELKFNYDYGFNTESLKDLHVFEYTIGYTAPLNEKWRFTAQLSPSVASNLKSGFNSDDLLWSGGILFIRTHNQPKKSRLTLGLTYNQTIGIPAPLPFVTYFRQINEHLTYTLGVPITKVKYFFNKKTSIESFLTLDGYYANLSNNIKVGDRLAEKISMTAIITGFGFDKYFGKRFNLFAKTGYTLRNSIRLVENINDKVFDFDVQNSFTLRVGFKFNF
jgi:hypothetical protein